MDARINHKISTLKERHRHAQTCLTLLESPVVVELGETMIVTEARCNEFCRMDHPDKFTVEGKNV